MLAVWLPLNGDLTNNGLENVTISGSGTFTADGKIGKCLSGGSTIVITSQTLANSKTWSVCFWGYVLSANVTGNWTRLIQMGDGGNNLRVEVCPKSYSSGTFCYSTHNNAAYKITTASLSAPSGGFYDQWHHFCMTSDGTTIYVYDNGTLRGTMPYNGSGAITGSFALENNSIIKKNDFRAFNTCLSPREVSELSKALVLHYPMTGGGRSGDNLVVGTQRNQYSNDLTLDNDRKSGMLSAGSGGNGVFSITEEDVPVGIYSYNVTNNTSGNRDYQQGGIPFISGKQYTASWWAKGNGACLFRSWNRTRGAEVIRDTWTLTSNWKYYTRTFTATQAMQDDCCTFHLGVTGNASIKIAGMKLEEGSHATPWMPNSADTAYTSMGYNDTTEYDTSGYLHNGTINGSVSYSSDTPRYSVSTHFTASGSQHIVIPSMTLDMTKFSVAAWFKADTAQIWARILDMGEKTGGAGYALLLALGQSGTTFTVAGRGPSGATFPDTSIQSINLGQWYHIVVTIDTKTCKAYINGSLVKTFTLNNAFSTSTPMALNYIGKSNWTADKYYDGNISDFRLYATALSAEDIQKLYNTSASIANNGVLMSYEFAET